MCIKTENIVDIMDYICEQLISQQRWTCNKLIEKYKLIVNKKNLSWEYYPNFPSLKMFIRMAFSERIASNSGSEFW